MSEVKQVIVMRTDLNMRKGKMIAQGAHAAMMFLTSELRKAKEEFRSPKWTPAQRAWMEGSFKKICVRADSEEQLKAILEKAKAAGLEAHMCVDNGLTEFKGVPTATCIAIGPDYDERFEAVTGDLTLL